MNGWEIVMEAQKYLGIPYIFGAEVNPDETEPKAFDCSEYVQYVLFKCGFTDFPDGSYNQYDYCKDKGCEITVNKARRIPGCLVFMEDDGRIHHVGFTTGQNETLESRGKDYGTGKWPWRVGWNKACKIPQVYYG